MTLLGSIRLAALILAALMISCKGSPESVLPDQPSADDLATAHRVLEKLVNAENYGQMGFDSLQQVKRAKFESPLRRHFIRPDVLRAYLPARDPATLLRDSREWIYPVSVDGSARCAVTMAQRESAWRVISLGYAQLARLIVQAQRDEAQKNNLDPNSLVIVELPDPNALFVGLRTDKKAPTDPGGSQALLLTWIHTSDPEGRPALTTEPAAKVMERLAARLQQRGRGPE